MAYQPAVRRTSGGDQIDVASSGNIAVASGGAITLASGATISLTGQALNTTGAVNGSSGTFTASIAASSGISGTSGVFTADVAITSGLAALKGTFSSAITGLNATLTSGISGTSGVFSADVSITSGLAALKGTFTSAISGLNATLTSGISGTSGVFSADVSVTSGLAALKGTFSSGVTASGGVISGQAGYKHYVETATTSWTSIAAYGISIIKSTDASAYVFALPAPVVGMEKTILSITPAGSTPGVPIITSSGASAGYGGNTSILFSSGTSTDPEWVRLVGQNSTNWLVLGFSTDVSFSAT